MHSVAPLTSSARRCRQARGAPSTTCWRAAAHLGCLCRAGGGGGRVLSKGPMAALRRALVSECLRARPARPARRGGPHAQGDPRTGRPPSRGAEGKGSGGEADRDEAAQGSGARPRHRYPDADLLCVLEHALAVGPDQQSARAHHPQSATTNTGGRRLSRWPIRHDAVRGTSASHRGNQMGYAALPHHRPIADTATSTTSCVETQTEAAPIRKCEKFWTQPVDEVVRTSVEETLNAML